MATVEQLIADGKLIDVLVPLDRGEQPWRKVIATPGFHQWMKNTLPNLVSSWNPDEDPAMQFDTLLHDFISGGPFPCPFRFKPWRKFEGSVWWLKTADLRIFGWFVKLDHFIAVEANPADLVKQSNLYTGHCSSVVRVRNNLDLDDPKYLQGGARDVISFSN